MPLNPELSITNLNAAERDTRSGNENDMISKTIFSADDPRLNEMTREQRIQLFYARELALGNSDIFLPRYRASDHDPDNPWADHAVPLPTNDSKISEIAAQLSIAGIRREISELIED